MQPVRRAAVRRAAAGRAAVRCVVAVLTLGAGLALTGCQSDPGVAAYVGSENITEAQVDQIFDNAQALKTEAAAQQAAAGPQPSAQPTPAPTPAPFASASEVKPSRSDVVTTLVLANVCAKLQAEQGFASTDITPEQIAAVDQVPPNSDYARERAKMYSCLAGIPVTSAAAPTDAELQQIYDRAKAKGLVEVPLSQIKDQLAADTGLQQAVAVNRTLTKMVNDGDVRVNPRYRPMEFTVSDLGSGEPLVVLQMGEPASDAVRDLG